MTTTSTELPGISLPRLLPWLHDVVPEMATEDLRAELIAGGKSNLTYLLSDGRSSWILRRPPLGHVLATAHDMGREYTVMSALRGTGVPVPTMFGLCTDPDLIGAPFYLMSHCPGVPYRSAAELTALGAERTHDLCARMIDTLALLHTVDPASVGLADFGRPDGYLARQVSRWKKQLDASHYRDLPLADDLHGTLSTRVPAQSAAGIVHGDFRLDNVLMDANDQPTAVLDWEMATLGDPLADLALTVVYSELATLPGGASVSDVATAPGFLSQAELIGRYGAHSDRDLSDIGFHLGLAAFKLAGILEGINFRHRTGQTVGEGFDGLDGAIEPLLEFGLNALKEHH